MSLTKTCPLHAVYLKQVVLYVSNLRINSCVTLYLMPTALRCSHPSLPTTAFMLSLHLPVQQCSLPTLSLHVHYMVPAAQSAFYVLILHAYDSLFAYRYGAGYALQISYCPVNLVAL